MAELEKVIGTFVIKTYPRDGQVSDWMICKYRDDETGREFAAAGYMLPDTRGIKACLVGQWRTDIKTGKKRLDVSRVEEVRATTKSEVVAYLISLQCGIGRGKAERVYKEFGERSWDIIDQYPEKLKGVPGIGEGVYTKLIQAIASHRSARHLLALLARAQITIGGDTLRKLIERFGESAADTLTDDPYQAYAIEGFSWEKCESLAVVLGIPEDAPCRLRGMVSKVLVDASVGGHVCLPKDMLLQQMVAASKCTPDACKQAINDVWKAGAIKGANGMIFLDRMYDEEALIASRLASISAAQHYPISGLEGIISDYEISNQISLADKQKAAIVQVFQHQASVITGGPGVGKTTVTKAILAVHKEVFGEESRPVLLAPTGKAARRMSEATGYPAATIHSAVGWRGDDKDVCAEGPIDGNLILIDESSMMDQKIASILLEHIEPGARVVFIGDIDQLPSVGAGYVLHDLIASEVIPTTRLDVIYRQAETSPIIANAHRINTGQSNLIEERTFRWVETRSEGETFLEACRWYARCVKAYGADNVILLNPQRNGTELSVENFNIELQRILNPPRDGERELKVGKQVFRAGDRVMELKNTAEAKNGDVGVIQEIARKPNQDNPDQWMYFANIEFNNDGVLHQYGADELKHVTHAWCTTVHKSQGSQYRTVLQIVSKAHPGMLKRNLVYTGVTRAVENVALIGERDALKIAVENNATEHRYTLLATRLRTLIKQNQ